MNEIFFRPEHAWVGDCMPCYYNNTYYMYYQCDRREPKPFPNGEPFGWSLAVSEDLVSFRDYGEVLYKGEHGSREHCLYAGSVIHALGKFRAFYTGECKYYLNRPDLPPKEVLMLAVSEDGITWEKQKKLSFSAPAGFEKDYFRDPFVCYCEEIGKWLMLVCAQKENGPRKRRGVLLYYTSTNLENWNYEGIFCSPDMYFLLQMPDLFRIGDWWYLLFSELDDMRRTRYRMSKSMFGPWKAPEDDCLDGRCFYAARTVKTEQKRIIFGWNPTRENDDDLGMWIWGGNAVQHEIYQRKDGTLGVKMPEQLPQLIGKRDMQIRDSISLSRIDGGLETVIKEHAKDVFRLEADVSYGAGTFGFGVKIYENSEEDLGYDFHFVPGENRFLFDKTPNYPWFRCMNRGLYRPFPVQPGEQFHVSLVVDHDIAVLYVNDIALNVRMTETSGSEIKLYVHNGNTEWRNIRLYEK